MTDISALDALIEAVEAGTFPADTSARDLGIGDCDGLPVIGTMYKAFSGSLDAAKALHEALLPGWRVATLNNTDVPDTRYNARGEWSVRLWDKEEDEGWSCAYGADDPARAWLISILKAYRGTLA